MSFVRKEEWKVVFLMSKITCLGEGNELCQKKEDETERKVVLLMRKITCLGEGNELFIKEEWKVVFLMSKITCLVREMSFVRKKKMRQRGKLCS
jgi:hypothetical protein